MAHTILGIDLGGHSVKLAQLEAGFRSLRLLALYERELLPPLPEATEPEPPLHFFQIAAQAKSVFHFQNSFVFRRKSEREAYFLFQFFQHLHFFD